MFQKIKHVPPAIITKFEQFRDMRIVGLLLFLVIVLMISWSGAKIIQTNYDLQQQIAHLEQENRVFELENQNTQLQNQYFETPQYLDIAAREHFGLAEEGETVLVVPEQVALSFTVDTPDSTAKATEEAEQKQPAYQRNFQAWMDFFLHRDE